MTKAKANVAALLKQFKSDQEAAFAQVALALLADEFGAPVARLDYEPVSWNLPGNRYTPDFMATLADGRVLWIEVKGSKKQSNYRDARSKLREAAAIYPQFTWVEAMVTLKRGTVIGINLEVINDE